MNSSKLILGLFLAVLVLTACQTQKNIDATVDATTGIGAIKKEQTAERNLAIAQAKIIWQQKYSLGEDLNAGPCLAERLIDDWSADVAHDPRQPIDNLPENQCQNFIQGKTHHFVELDTNGNLLRAE